MTVYDVLKMMEPAQRVRIVDDTRGSVSGSAFSMHEMLSASVKGEKVGMLRAEGGVIVMEVAEE